MENDTVAEQAKVMLSRVRAALSANDVAEAERIALKMTEMFPGAAENFAAMGAVRFASSDVKAAREAFEQAQALFPTDLDLCKEYAFSLFFTEQKEEALLFSKKTFDAYPNNWGAFDTHRHFLRATGRADFTASEVFQHIYSHGLWKKGSGAGSDPAITEPYKKYLASFIAEHSIKSIVDVGCGDWQFMKDLDLQGVDYLGIDIVPSVVDSLKAFEREGVIFKHLDFSSSNDIKADLIVIKEVLQHCSIDKIRGILKNLKNYKFALITNQFSANALEYTNIEIPNGSCRPIELRSPPFNLTGSYVIEFGPNKEIKTFLHTLT